MYLFHLSWFAKFLYNYKAHNNKRNNTKHTQSKMTCCFILIFRSSPSFFISSHCRLMHNILYACRCNCSCYVDIAVPAYMEKYSCHSQILNEISAAHNYLMCVCIRVCYGELRTTLTEIYHKQYLYETHNSRYTKSNLNQMCCLKLMFVKSIFLLS